MGLILDVKGSNGKSDDSNRVHAEARRESFVILDDYGKGFSVELEWDWLPDLERAVAALRRHADDKKLLAPAKMPVAAS